MELPEDVEALLTKYNGVWFPTGSRYTCDPAPQDTDQDVLVLVLTAGILKTMFTELETIGFSWDHGEGYNQDGWSIFSSYRRGDLNLIITEDEDFAASHNAATHVCKTLNLLEKTQRIMVFQACLYHEQMKILLEHDMTTKKLRWKDAVEILQRDLDRTRAAEILRAAAEDAQLVMNDVNHDDTVSINQHACISQVLVNLANAINVAERAGVKRAVVV